MCVLVESSLCQKFKEFSCRSFSIKRLRKSDVETNQLASTIPTWAKLNGMDFSGCSISEEFLDGVRQLYSHVQMGKWASLRVLSRLF